MPPTEEIANPIVDVAIQDGQVLELENNSPDDVINYSLHGLFQDPSGSPKVSQSHIYDTHSAETQLGEHL